MELALLILVVIFATNVVSWIGKSVLVELASLACLTQAAFFLLLTLIMYNRVAGIRCIPTLLRAAVLHQAKSSEKGDLGQQGRAECHEFARPVCQMGKVAKKAGQGSSRSREA